MSRRRAHLLIFALSLCLIQPALAQKPPLQGFDAYVNKALRDWGCPGLAIAVVKNDAVVLTRGYGVREIGTSTPVDEQTVFGIASCSKAFTAAAIGILVDEGKIRWDDPVTKHLTGFELYDPYVTREITIRDLLCHRSGLPAFGGDLIWWGSTYDSKETLRRVRYVKPVSSFRSKYAYQNIMFVAAGAVIGSVSGKSWSEFVQDRILTPLGMTASSSAIAHLKSKDNLATPHMRIGGTTTAIPWRNSDNGAGAIGINSNVSDLAKWIRLQLGKGTYAGKQIYSVSVSEEMWTPQTIVPTTIPTSPLPAWLRPRFSAYGLGWGIADYRGHTLIRHYGETDGMSSLVALMPEEGLGVVILTNLHTTSLHTALLYRLLDAYLKARPEDWSKLYLTVRENEEQQARSEEQRREQARIKSSPPTLPLGKYVGKYEDTIYGSASVEEENGRLVVRLTASPTYIGDLEHWHFDTFLSRWRDPVAEKTFVSFTLNPKGEVDDMKLKVADFIDFGEYVFKRLK